MSIPEYPDFEELMTRQIALLENSKIKKEVWLDETSEVQEIEMDSTGWAEELSFLKEINPNQPEYVGAFKKSKEGERDVLQLDQREKGAIKKVVFLKRKVGYENISATFHEDKDVYVHHREIEMSFEEGVLSTIKIDGYQKMMLKDTVWFGINVEVQ